MSRSNLPALMREGMALYPSGMGDSADLLPDRPAWITGDTGRAARNAPRFVPVKRTQAWGSGTPSSPVVRQRNRQQFVTWLKKNMPKAYSLAVQKAGRPPDGALGSLNDDGQTWWQKFTDTLVNVGQTALAYKTQKDLLAVQLDRAREGLPPLNTTQYQPTVNVQADPAAVQTAINYAGAGISSALRRYWWVPVAGIGAYLVLRK